MRDGPQGCLITNTSCGETLHTGRPTAVGSRADGLVSRNATAAPIGSARGSEVDPLPHQRTPVRGQDSALGLAIAVARVMTCRLATASLLLAGALLSTNGCNSPFCDWSPSVCAGDEMICASVQGCVVGAPSCQFAQFGDTCSQQKTEASCGSTTTTDPCVWNAAGRCASACTTFSDAKSCQSFYVPVPSYPNQPNYPCAWTTCSGTPIQQPCDNYSTAACPSSLQCYVNQPDPIGT
jgi:hypothetical protein